MSSLPSGWNICSLSDICEFQRGLTYQKKDEVEHSNNAVLRANNVSLDSGKLNFDEIRYISDTISIAENKKVRKGCLLVCTASGSKKHLGKVALIDDDYPFAFGGFMGMLKPKPIVDSKYLYWVTRSKDYSDYIEQLSDGANINNLKFSQLGGYQFPVPPLPEQKRIVAILDEALSGIETAAANTQKNLANARELFESYLKAVFSQCGKGWIETQVGDQITLQRGFDITKKEQKNGLVPVISSGGVKSYHDTAKADGPGVVIGRKGSLGTIHYIDRSYWPHDTTLWVKDFKLNHPKIVYYLLKSIDLKELDSGTANPSLNRNLVHPLRIGWPEREFQDVIVGLLDSVADESLRLESIYQQKLTALVELKQSLLQKAFSGELTAGKMDRTETLKEEACA